MNTSPPSQTDRRNSSGGSSFTSTNSAGTASHNNNHNHNHHHAMSTDCQDPLAALERDLLAHPHRRYSHSHYPHPPVARQQEAHLVPPSSNNDSRGSRSPSTSPSPSPAARRCMAATAAWTPSLDRRQSWDGQAYRRAMMLQSTGLVCGCHPTNAAETVNGGTRTHHHHRHNSSGGSGPSTRSIYEADRGFSEVVGSTRM